MPESLLTILKFLLLALLYLFFLRVLRAVWAEVHAPRAQASGAAPTRATVGRGRDRGGSGGRARPPRRLRVAEPSEHRGKTYELLDELTLGRAAGCQIRLDDSYTSQLHARIFKREGQFLVEDLGSTNGTYLNRRGTKNREKVAGALALREGDVLYVGKTALEVCK